MIIDMEVHRRLSLSTTIVPLNIYLKTDAPYRSHLSSSRQDTSTFF